MCDCKSELILHLTKKCIKERVETMYYKDGWEEKTLEGIDHLINTFKEKSVEELEETLLNQI
jgi:hypothetical protein